MSETRYVMQTKEGQWVSIDQSSGGYPHFVDSLFRAEKFETPLKALEYRKHWWDEGWTLHRLVLKTVPELITPAMEAEARGDKEFAEYQRLAKKFGQTGTGECPFVEAWIGKCKKTPEVGELYCERHKEIKCFECGAQATKNCGHTSQFVCGAPMCDQHRHHSDG